MANILKLNHKILKAQNKNGITIRKTRQKKREKWKKYNVILLQPILKIQARHLLKNN